jgi:DUF1009 family protein
VERALGLICGAGALPARMAADARRQGWRVVAFTFAPSDEGAEGLARHADAVVPSRVGELGAVLARLVAEDARATLFSGKFWMTELLAAAGRDGRGDGALDAATAGLWTHARSLGDADFTAAILAVLARQGIEVLDQRAFLGEAMIGAGVLTARAPSAEEAADARRGLAIARALAHTGAGQTIVLRRGVVTALEAVEGTTEAIRRGCELAGAGAVIAKAVADAHDYRFDAPAIGPDTVEAAARGGAAVIAVSAGHVMLLDRAAATRRADAAGIAIVGVDGA